MPVNSGSIDELEPDGWEALSDTIEYAKNEVLRLRGRQQRQRIHYLMGTRFRPGRARELEYFVVFSAEQDMTGPAEVSALGYSSEDVTKKNQEESCLFPCRAGRGIANCYPRAHCADVETK